MKTKKYIRVVVATMLVGSALILQGCANNVITNINNSMTEEVITEAQTSADSTYDSVAEKMDKLDVLIDNYFYFDEDQENEREYVYKGMVAGLGDPYSVYYTADEYKDLMEKTEGSYYGIGVQVTQSMETKLITITKIFKDSPAQEAGLLPGDVIVKVGDRELSDEDLTEVVTWIKGDEGTSVPIQVYRESEKDYIDFTVERRNIENPTVEYEMLDNSIGYIVVSSFYEVTADQFIAAMDDLDSKGAKGLIVDLRDNGGGLVSTASKMLDYILSEGDLLYTRDKDGNIMDTISTTDTHTYEKPVVVLINKNSASASEIFSGDMQDHGYKIVGEKSFGKGIVQRVFPLEDGSAVKLTIARYFTSNNRDIHEEGITPDYEVEQPKELLTQVVVEHKDDVQLQKAIEVITEQIK